MAQRRACQPTRRLSRSSPSQRLFASVDTWPFLSFCLTADTYVDCHVPIGSAPTRNSVKSSNPSFSCHLHVGSPNDSPYPTLGKCSRSNFNFPYFIYRLDKSATSRNKTPICYQNFTFFRQRRRGQCFHFNSAPHCSRNNTIYNPLGQIKLRILSASKFPFFATFGHQ